MVLGRDHSRSMARFQESSVPRLELLFPILPKVPSVTAQRPSLLPRLILLPGALGIPLIYTSHQVSKELRTARLARALASALLSRRTWDIENAKDRTNLRQVQLRE